MIPDESMSLPFSARLRWKNILEIIFVGEFSEKSFQYITLQVYSILKMLRQDTSHKRLILRVQKPVEVLI
jgi:hypothetical protein